jgi:hypothetical protein
MLASVFGSPPLQAIAQDLVDDCLLSFQSGSSGQLAQAYDTIYSPTTPYGHEILNIIGWVIEEQGEEDATFAFSYQSDALGEAIRQAAQFGADHYGFEFAAEATHGPQDSDLSAQLQQLLAAEPDYIVYGGLPSQLAFLSAGGAGCRQRRAVHQRHARLRAGGARLTGGGRGADQRVHLQPLQRVGG